MRQNVNPSYEYYKHYSLRPNLNNAGITVPVFTKLDTFIMFSARMPTMYFMFLSPNINTIVCATVKVMLLILLECLI
jgi:hypothetical protein